MIEIANKKLEISFLGLYLKSAIAALIFFCALRALFLLFQIAIIKTSLPNDAFHAFSSGLLMDISTWAYLVFFPGILLLFQRWIPFQKIWSVYLFVLMLIVSGVFAADAILYKEWGFRMDITPFKYLWGSQEVMHFISLSMMFQFVTLFVLHLTIAYYIYKIFLKKNSFITWNVFHFIGAFAFAFLLIIPMRGGFGLAPMNPSKVYFSKNLFSNHVAINPLWNIFYTLNQEWNKNSSPNFSTPEKTKQTLDSLYSRSDTSQYNLFLDRRPNQIVIIILESFTHNLTHLTHKNIEVTPRLNEWIRKGLYYNNAFSSGDRTDKGLVSILSGFPSQPQSSIMHYPKKSQLLPSLIKVLSPLRFSSIFYYGGDIHFAGMKSYLLAMGFDTILDKDYFSQEDMNVKWGVHDHILFRKVFDDYVNENSEKLQVALSLSSHPPYDIPEPNTWNEKDEESQFLNAAHYTDKHFGILLDEMSQTPNWKNTLVIVLADHGCRFPGNVAYHLPEKFKIPILWTGGVIRKDSISNAVISQQDIPASLLSQLQLPNKEFTFSQNIFSKKYNAFAYYSFNNGIAWNDEEGTFIYSLDNLNWITEKPNHQKEYLLKTYIQAVWNDFNSK